MQFARSKTNVDFSPMSLSSGASGGNYAAAAGAVNLGDSFAAMRDKDPFNQLSAQAMTNAAAERVAALNAEAGMYGAGMTAYGNTSAAALELEAKLKAAEKAADTSTKNLMIGGLSGVLGTGLKLLTGGLG